MKTMVWHASLQERDWLEALFADCAKKHVEDPSFLWHGDEAIHVVSGNITPLESLVSWLNEVRARGQDITLFQVSDEWLSGSYRAYAYFDRVFRNHGTWLANDAGVLTLPLGYPNGGKGPSVFAKASSRPHLWGFAGEVKTSRRAMIEAFRVIAPGFCLDTLDGNGTALDRASYRNMISKCKFLPCPMGNVFLETWRFYEALELGAVPLVERRPTMDYYTRLLGKNPIPTFWTWRQAANFARNLENEPVALDALQAEITDWWRAKQQTLRNDVNEFLASPSYADSLKRFAAKPRNRWSRVGRALGRLDLERHRSPLSTMQRMSRRLMKTVAGRTPSNG